MVEDSELWDVIENTSFIPTGEIKIGDVTSQVPKTKKEFDDADRLQG